MNKEQTNNNNLDKFEGSGGGARTGKCWVVTGGRVWQCGGGQEGGKCEVHGCVGLKGNEEESRIFFREIDVSVMVCGLGKGI